MPIANEVEAKLLVPRLAELDAIAARPRLGGCALRLRRRAQLETTYVDTEDFALLAAGVCLRVRRDGERSEATAKWMGRVEGDVHVRPELTVELPGERTKTARRRAVELQLPPGPLYDQLTAIVAGRSLVPILVTHIDRRIFDVVRKDGRRGEAVAVAELALDRVRSADPRRLRRGVRQPAAAQYGELELELRDGTVAELRVLADLVRREHGLLPTDETKFSRGMDAVHGSGVLARLRAAPPEPGPDDTSAAALRRVLGLQLARIRAHDPGTRAGEDPEALHQQRVGVRRARAVLRALGDALPPRRRAWLRRELRWLGRALGTVRDLDVQLEGATQLGRALPLAERGALSAHVGELQAERARQRAQLLTALDSPRYLQLLLELEELTRERDAGVAGIDGAHLLAVEGRERAERALTSLHERGREAVSRLSTTPPEALHALRIRARRTRYLLEVLAELGGAAGERVIEHLVRLQDALGEHQDAVVAGAAIAEHQTRLQSARRGARTRGRTRARSHAPTHAGMSRLAARERRRASRARQDFARAFRRLEREWRDVERLLSRLSRLTRQQQQQHQQTTAKRAAKGAAR